MGEPIRSGREGEWWTAPGPATVETSPRKAGAANPPDPRLEKVIRLRRAIAQATYDEDALLDKMLRHLEGEIGTLCRRELGE